MLRTYLRGIQYTNQECDYIIKRVLALTDFYCPSYFPGLNRKQRKTLEFERLAFLPGDTQNYKLCDVIHNISEIPNLNDEKYMKMYLAEKEIYITRIEGHVGIGQLDPNIVKLAKKTIKNAKKKVKEKFKQKAG